MGTVSPEAMREALGAFPTGIVLVAAETGGRPTGLLATSFTSVSLDLPLVSVSLSRTSKTWHALRNIDRWGISVMGSHQTDEFRQLSGASSERFHGVNWAACGDGSVVLREANATLTVSREAEIDGGDHVILLLRVLSLQRVPKRAPLIFYGSQPGRLNADHPLHEANV